MGNEQTTSSSSEERENQNENGLKLVNAAVTTVAVIGAASYLTYKLFFEEKEESNFQKIECEEKSENEALDVKDLAKEHEGMMKSIEGIPDGFICPITHEVMEYPVILVETGHTFEKEALEKWLEKSSTCPMTGKELNSKKFIVVYSLKKAIDHWRVEKSKESKEIKE